MKKTILALFSLCFFTSTFLFAQTSKTGIAYLLPVENIVADKKADSTGRDQYPMYQRWKVLLVNPITLLPDNPLSPESVVLYVKMKDASAKTKMDSIVGVVKNEPVVLDGTLFKEKKLNKLRRRGDVEVSEAFQVDNWAPLKWAKERIAVMNSQVLVDAQKLDSALKASDQISVENVKLAVENRELKKEVQKEKEKVVKTPVPALDKPKNKEEERRKGIVIEAVRPPGS